jgi:hypothetical protein
MARFRTWIDQSFADIADDYVVAFLDQERLRKGIIAKIQYDLFNAALGLGQTEAQAVAKIDALFAAYSGDWALYILTGSPAVSTSIQNDATLPWLSTLVAGVSIRQRILNRLA